MRHVFAVILLFATLLSCKKQESGSQSSSSAPNFQTSSCTIGKWSTTPVTLAMSSEFSGDFTNADIIGGLNPLERMAKVWNDAVSPTTLLSVPFAAATTTGFSSLSSFRDGEFGIYKSHTWFNGVSSGALAITQYFGIVRSDNSLGTYIDLTHADIIFNYRDFGSSFSFNGNPITTYDVPTVILHEMGHFLGLCHESSRSSIMAPYYAGVQRTLQTWDTSKVRGLYLNNQNLSAISTRTAINALSMPSGTVVKGIVELNADGKCRHYLNGKVVYEHNTDLGLFPIPNWYKNLPLK